MPELPDVEIFRRYVESTSLHKKITKVSINNPELLTGTTRAQLEKTLRGNIFKTTKRHGKHLFIGLNQEKYLVLHFGMTGYIKYYRKPEEKPDHERFRCTFENQYHLAFSCQRKLGKISLTQNVAKFCSAHSLGPDANKLNEITFRDIISGSKSMIKSTLMDQGKIAGIGNIYSDEILFRAGIHPKRSSSKLTKEEMSNLFQAIRDVLQTATEKNADPEQMPNHYLLPHRDGDGLCPNCGGNLKKIKASGRNCYICPKCQK